MTLTEQLPPPPKPRPWFTRHGLALRGAVVLALLWLHAWRDGIVLAFCAVAIPAVQLLGG